MALPSGWETGVDPTGRTYYVNHQTQQTQWEPPTDTGGAAPPPSYYPSQAKVANNPQALPRASPVNTLGVQADHQPYPVQVIQQQPGDAPQVIVVQPGLSGIPRNAPEGGRWIQEKYCGIITWLVGCFVFPCVCCCPCDDRSVYIVNNTRYNKYGAVIPPNCCS